MGLDWNNLNAFLNNGMQQTSRTSQWQPPPDWPSRSSFTAHDHAGSNSALLLPYAQVPAVGTPSTLSPGSSVWQLSPFNDAQQVPTSDFVPPPPLRQYVPDDSFLSVPELASAAENASVAALQGPQLLDE
ncbi:hypothetical protein V8E36_005940 [Tilletia maclaganii]